MWLSILYTCFWAWPTTTIDYAQASNRLKAPSVYPSWSHLTFPLPIILLQILCEGITYSNWPWGTQMCNLSFGSWSYDSSDIVLSFYDNLVGSKGCPKNGKIFISYLYLNGDLVCIKKRPIWTFWWTLLSILSTIFKFFRFWVYPLHTSLSIIDLVSNLLLRFEG